MSKLNSADLPVGTKIYYGGDMANEDGFGIIQSDEASMCGRVLKIKMDDGRQFSVFQSNFSDHYDGTGLTKFVKSSEYKMWRLKQIQALNHLIQAKEQESE